MNYELIPKELHARIIEAVENEEHLFLLIIHNKYKLTIYDYKCCGLNDLINHYKHGIKIGAIKID